MKALVRRPGPRLADGLVTNIARQPVDLARASEQHDAYVDTLRDNGFEPIYVAPADDCPDAVFIEDTVVVVDDVAILTRPGAPERRPETAGTLGALNILGIEVRRIEEPGTLDGGDVLQVGDVIYVGSSLRTNKSGIEQLAAHVEDIGRIVVPVGLQGVLHLKSAVTALPDGTVIGLPGTTDLPDVLEVSEEEGAHIVILSENTVLLDSSAPRTVALLKDRGLRTVLVDISEYQKLEGCVTCLSVLIRT